MRFRDRLIIVMVSILHVTFRHTFNWTNFTLTTAVTYVCISFYSLFFLPIKLANHIFFFSGYKLSNATKKAKCVTFFYTLTNFWWRVVVMIFFFFLPSWSLQLTLCPAVKHWPIPPLQMLPSTILSNKLLLFPNIKLWRKLPKNVNVVGESFIVVKQNTEFLIFQSKTVRLHSQRIMYNISKITYICLKIN